jgi:hypothetical protein
MTKQFKKSGISPLVQVDKDELGDKRLDPKESVAREREELLNKAAAARVWGQDELEQAERSLGPRMSTGDLISRIRKLNHTLKFLDGIKGHVAVYRPIRPEERDIESEDHQVHADEFFNDHKYVSGFPLGELPEWGHVMLDTSNLPTREVRGWRTVLIGLIKNRAVSYRQVVKEFGEPTDKRSRLWHEQLAPYKQY